LAAIRRITLLTNPDLCNLHCPLCFLNQRGLSFGEISGAVGEMDFGVAKAVVEKYGSILDDEGCPVLKEVIPSTMGEPLLYSHFSELLDLCGSVSVPLNLTTNGTFPGVWGDEGHLLRLLKGCSDIKISSLASESFGGWRDNVERLLSVRRELIKSGESRIASVSVQATLHGKNLMMIPELIAWATAVGIDRIKWNRAVFLSDCKPELRMAYELDRSVDELRQYILNCGVMCGSSVRNEGSVFASANVSAKRFSLADGTCPFAEELWILPDGSEQHCPHPERRFGNSKSQAAECCFIG